MHPTIFGLDSYLLMMIMGYVAAFLGIYLANKKHPFYHLPTREILYLSIFIIFGVLSGSLLLFALTNLAKVNNVEQFFELFTSGGFVFYGGLIGGIMMGLLYCKIYHITKTKYADLIICFLPLGHMIGRLGCFLAGCCYGKVTDSWLGMTFPANSHAAIELNNGNPVKVFPVQLFEAIFLLILFSGLLVYFCRKKEHRPLFITGAYLSCYGLWRFLIEFLRGDEIRGVYILSTSQWISIVTVFVGVLLLLNIPQKYLAKKRQKE